MHDLKETYRARSVAARRALPVDLVSERSRRVVERVVASPLFERCTAVLLYSASDNEVDTTGLRAAAEAFRRRVYFPRLAAGTAPLSFFQVDRGESLVPGRWGIREPAGDVRFEPHAEVAALVVVPGVAFDLTGARLGRGGGHYDRTLRDLGPSCVSVGLAFDMQLVSSLPQETHDEPVSFVAIETGILRCARATPRHQSWREASTKETPWLCG